MFRLVVAAFAASALMMVLSPSVTFVIAAKAVAGASAAIIVPSLVALIPRITMAHNKPPRSDRHRQLG